MLLDLLAAVQEVPETAARATWAFVRDLLLLVIAALTCWWTVIRPWWRKVEEKREAERAAAKEAAREEVEQIVVKQVAPVLAQLRPNGGSSTHDFARKSYEEACRARLEATAVRTELREHIEDGEQYLVRVRAALADKGIELPDHEHRRAE